MGTVQIGYTVDSVGNPLTMTDWVGTSSYAYDANNRLTSAVPPNPVPSQPAGGAYGYDWVGNRLHPPAHANPMAYNAADQLTAWPGMHGYQYDTAGNLVSVTGAGTASYTYTPAGLLNTATYSISSGSGNHTLTNTWDADSNRVGMSANGQAHSFVYDITAGIPAVLQENTPSSTVYYIREPNGALIARAQGSALWYYHFDELGSTRLITDSAGSVTDRYDYDAYGAVLWHERGTNSIDQPYQFVGALGYHTHYQEPDLGLLQLGVRFCDPQVGRFTEVDPAKIEFNRYMYVSGAPSTGTDADGRCQCGVSPTSFNIIKSDGKYGYWVVPYPAGRCRDWQNWAYARCKKQWQWGDVNWDSNDENNKWSHGGEDDPAENLLTGVACSLIMDVMEGKCEAKADEGYNACKANSHNQPIHVVNPWIPYAPPDPTNFGF